MINKVIRGDKISSAWLEAIKYLSKNNNQAYNLIVEIEEPLEDKKPVRDKLNLILSNNKDFSVETVARTIFPDPLLNSKKPREDFYTRFIKTYPNLRRIRENRNGTYFGRLVAWNYIDNENQGFNQLESVITKLIREKNNGRGLRVIYEMIIFNPEVDHNTQMGFPCLSYISLKVRNGSIDLTAVYRNQYFVQKAYGNYLGLGMLLDFICKESKYNVGKLTCIATHAHLDIPKVKKHWDDLLNIDQTILSFE